MCVKITFVFLLRLCDWRKNGQQWKPKEGKKSEIHKLTPIFLKFVKFSHFFFFLAGGFVLINNILKFNYQL